MVQAWCRLLSRLARTALARRSTAEEYLFHGKGPPPQAHWQPQQQLHPKPLRTFATANARFAVQSAADSNECQQDGRLSQQLSELAARQLARRRSLCHLYGHPCQQQQQQRVLPVCGQQSSTATAATASIPFVSALGHLH